MQRKHEHFCRRSNETRGWHLRSQHLHEPGFDGKNVLIKVHVIPNAKEVRVVKVGEADFEVKIDEKAIDGRANKRLMEILSEHLRVPKSRIFIMSGARSRDKILQVVS